MSFHPEEPGSQIEAPRTLPRWPSYADDEIAAAAAVLTSGRVNYWTGDEGRTFEQEFAAHVGVRHGVAVANGTVALDLALRAFGLGGDAEVITTPRTFVASASSAVLCGARPIFADVDRDSQNITAEAIARVLSPRTRAIVAVHLGGWPCEMESILDLARAHDLVVIEDCAQATGARYRGRVVGGIGHAGAFSFCQDKIITTGGEGGMLTTHDERAWMSAWSFKDHGKNYDAAHAPGPSAGYKWVHDSFGTNGRMTEMQAAIGRVQLRKLDQWLALRRRNAMLLYERLSKISCLRCPLPPPHVEHAWYRFYCFVEPAALKSAWDRDRILSEAAAMGLPVFAGSCSEIYREKAFQRAGLCPEKALPVARELGGTSIALLVHPTLSVDDMLWVADRLARILAKACR